MFTEEEVTEFKKDLLKSYSPRRTRTLLDWKQTRGDGSRLYAVITGNNVVHSNLLPKIINASKGVITETLKIEKFALLMGGSDIQAPHYDGRGVGKGVSVIFATDDNTHLCIFNPKSVKDKGNGKQSIEYRKVSIPKGRAIFFNSFLCLHGGFKYEEKYERSSCLKGNRHLRIFARFTDPSTMNDFNDFNLFPDVDEYIEVG
jgi:hypothetical protein